MFRQFDEPEITFEGTLDEETLVDFVVDNAFPLLGEIGPENYHKYLDRGAPFVWFFLNKDKDASVMTVGQTVAKEFKDRFSFVHLDGVRWAEHAKTMGLNGETPGIVLEDRDTRKNYVFPQKSEVTVDALRAHIQGFLDKSLQPTVRSEPIPEKNDGPVKVVVGKTFDSIVLDTTKDVMVEFYAPWCGHCKSLAPKYEKLGESFADTPSVVIAKVDATENDTPVDIRGYPTIYFYPADNKAKPITYEGERAEGPMADFIRKHASTLKGTSAPSSSSTKTSDDSHDEL